MSKRKYTKEFKLRILKEHEEGISFYSLEKKYGIALGIVKRWNSAYQAHGEDVLEPQNSALCRYTAEFKKKVFPDYLSGGEGIVRRSVLIEIAGNSVEVAADLPVLPGQQGLGKALPNK